MADAAFTQVDPDLAEVLAELREREPIFHTPAFGTTVADLELAMAPDYWEVGASGRCYSRECILRHLATNPPVDAVQSGWQTYDHAVSRLGADTYLFTYTLRQKERLSRRATIWQRALQRWRILYHQGTIVSSEKDDGIPKS